jgi:beta-fructofuranosidase
MRIYVPYATTEGQTAKIADYIAEVVRAHGHQADTVDIGHAKDGVTGGYDGVIVAVGAYHDGNFKPDRWSRLTYGPSMYAASAFRDRDGRPGLVCWLREITDPKDGWAGATSLPALLTLDSDQLRLQVHPELDDLRRSLEGAANALDIDWNPNLHAADEVARLLLRASDGTVRAEIEVSAVRLTASRSGGTTTESWAMPYPGGPIRIVVDGPVLEVFTSSAMMGIPVPASGWLRPEASGPERLRWHALAR